MEKILIVEDDELIAELERDYLEASGYEVVLAFDGEAGLRSSRRAVMRRCWILCFLKKTASSCAGRSGKHRIFPSFL